MGTKNLAFAVIIALLALPAASAFADNSKKEEYVPIDFSSSPEEENRKKKFKSSFMEKENLEEQIIQEIPFAEDLKPVWNLVDGDTDIYITNLRVDRKNKGLVYKTNALPLIGKLDGVELKFKAGEKTEFSFESDRLPFGSKIDGFTLKGSVGENASISARYTIALD